MCRLPLATLLTLPTLLFALPSVALAQPAAAKPVVTTRPATKASKPAKKATTPASKEPGDDEEIDDDDDDDTAAPSKAFDLTTAPFNPAQKEFLRAWEKHLRASLPQAAPRRAPASASRQLLAAA